MVSVMRLDKYVGLLPVCIEKYQNTQFVGDTPKSCCSCLCLLVLIICHWLNGYAVATLIGHRTCDLQIAGLSPGWAPLYSGHTAYTCVPVSPNSMIWYLPRGSDVMQLGR